MARGRPRRNQEEDVQVHIEDLFGGQTEEKTVSCYLAENYFDMCKQLKIDLECPVCMDKLCCKKCFCLLRCGHYFHLSCWMKTELNNCPTCRG